MILPKSIRRLVESFEKLPGIGPKTAQRLTFYLLNVPQHELKLFGQNLIDLKANTVLCSVCFNVAETDPCPICGDRARDKSTICLVEQPLDVLALEKTGKFRGVYHVLHGIISPLNNIGPEELYIKQLLRRLRVDGLRVKELIIALNPNMEGEATAMYIKQKCQMSNVKCQMTRLGQGLPTGADLQYADELTLSRALEGRSDW